jgi:hypothetical protein
MADAARDNNFVPALIASSSSDGQTPVRLYANPSTHRLLVDATSGVTGPVSSTDNAIVRFDGTTGQTIQNSAVTIADTTGTVTVAAKAYTWPGQSGVFSTGTSGSGAPATTPSAICQLYIDTTGPDVYISTGTSSSADWTLIFATP